jgi:hypothetical protein
VRGFLLQEHAPLATRIIHELLPLYPNGAALAQLASHLGVNDLVLNAAIELLRTWNAVTVESGAIRIERGLKDRAKC